MRKIAYSMAIAIAVGLICVGGSSSGLAAGSGSNSAWRGDRAVKAATQAPAKRDKYREVGRASWYGAELSGRRTASGETFNANAHTAAHVSLPLGSKVRVTNLENGRSTVVRINDRHAANNGRVIDLSRRAAADLGIVSQGTARVALTKAR